MATIILMIAGLAAGAAMGNIAPVVRLVYFVHLEFKDEDVRLNTSPINVDWGGFTWLGTGILGEITPPTENIDMSIDRLTMRFTGVPVSEIASARAKIYRNRKAYVYAGDFNEDWAIDTAPKLAFSGEMDTMVTESSGDSASIVVEVTGAMAEWQRANTYRYTDEMQRDRFTGDLGLEFVNRQLETRLSWGIK